MVTAMTASKHSKKILPLLIALSLSACQPPSSTDESPVAENVAAVDTPLIITSDSVTMTPEQILSIKTSRYQPSLGLQGRIEPIRQTKLIAAHPIDVQQVLVKEGQWVEKGTPLLIVKRLNTPDKAETTEQEGTAPKDIKDKVQGSADSLSSTSDQNVSDSKTASPKNITDDSENAQATKTAIDDTDTRVKENTDNVVDAKKPTPQYKLVTVRASFSGRVENLYIKAAEKLDARTTLLQLSDETKLHFSATLPIQAKPQLSVGQTVNFTVEGVSDKFTGQVSKLLPTSQPKKLLVYVNVIDNEMSRDKLLPNMKVTGRVNYGQIDVGTIVPEQALHDVDLTELQIPPHMPLRPLTADVWIIGQDQRLTRQQIEVVEYNPSTQQYLIAGVSNDSLICLADLPIDSKGKKVIVS